MAGSTCRTTRSCRPRADGSGDTFIFTQFLTFSTPDVHLSASSDLLYDWETRIGYGTTVPWPPAGQPHASGNQGHGCRKSPVLLMQLGYLGGSFEADANKAGLEIAMLETRTGISCSRPPPPLPLRPLAHAAHAPR